MTSYTDQKTRNLRIYSNDCERAERASRKFSPFPVLSLLVNSIFVGAIPPVPPPPPGYASGAHATEIICSRAKRGENGKWMNKFVFLTLELTSLAYILYFFFPPSSPFFFLGGGGQNAFCPPPHILDWGGGAPPCPPPTSGAYGLHYLLLLVVEFLQSGELYIICTDLVTDSLLLFITKGVTEIVILRGVFQVYILQGDFVEVHSLSFPLMCNSKKNKSCYCCALLCL